MFFTGIMQHLNTLNLALQGKNKLVSDLSQTGFGSQNKIIIFQNDLLSKRFSHFPNLSRRINAFPNIEIKNMKQQDYNDKLQGLHDNFQERFNDLRKLKPCFAFLVNPFDIDVITSGGPMLSFVIRSTCYGTWISGYAKKHALKMAHKTLTTLEFWKQVPAAKHPELKETTIRLISVFSTTYCCKSFYSIMKFVKSKHRATLTNQHVKELLQTALTSYQFFVCGSCSKQVWSPFFYTTTAGKGNKLLPWCILSKKLESVENLWSYAFIKCLAYLNVKSKVHIANSVIVQ